MLQLPPATFRLFAEKQERKTHKQQQLQNGDSETFQAGSLFQCL
jgi:hypothetical protein